MQRSILVLAFFLAAGPARAWEPPPAVIARLEAGEVASEASGDVNRGPITLRGAVDINAPAEAVWRIMSDCARAVGLAPSLRRCRVVEAGPGGRWDERELVQRYPFLVRSIHSRVRAEYDPPRLITFQCLPGGDILPCAGEWRLTPLDGGRRTRLTYENTLTSAVHGPGPMVRTLLRRDTAMGLSALRRAVRGR